MGRTFPHPHPLFWVIVFTSIAAGAAIPFARREGVVGVIAFTVIVAADVILIGLLLWGVAKEIARRYRGDSA